MPYLKLNTNLEIKSEKTQPILTQLSQLVASETGKPERYVMVEINHSQAMIFAGSPDPLAFVECKSIGLSTMQAKSLSSSLCLQIKQQLGIAPDRIYIEFSNCSADLFGWNGSTFG
jgi:phenylpyruvate tautomerase